MSYSDPERYAQLFRVKGHTIKRDIDGQVDNYGFFYFEDVESEASDEHCGPVCITCGYGFCMYCDEHEGFSDDIPVCRGIAGGS